MADGALCGVVLLLLLTVHCVAPAGVNTFFGRAAALINSTNNVANIQKVGTANFSVDWHMLRMPMYRWLPASDCCIVSACLPR